MSIQVVNQIVQDAIDIPMMDIKNISNIILDYTTLKNIKVRCSIFNYNVNKTPLSMIPVVQKKVHTMSLFSFEALLDTKKDLIKKIINSEFSVIEFLDIKQKSIIFRSSADFDTCVNFLDFLKFSDEIVMH